jgi:hypothetical protein
MRVLANWPTTKQFSDYSSTHTMNLYGQGRRWRCYEGRIEARSSACQVTSVSKQLTNHCHAKKPQASKQVLYQKNLNAAILTRHFYEIRDGNFALGVMQTRRLNIWSFLKGKILLPKT